AGGRQAPRELARPETVGEDAALAVPQPLADAGLEGVRLCRESRGLRLMAERAGDGREHFAVERQQAVETDIGAIEAPDVGAEGGFVMDRRVVHARLILGGELGAAVEAAADRRGAVLDEAVSVAVAHPPPPTVVAGEDIVAVAKDAWVAAAQIEHPDD